MTGAPVPLQQDGRRRQEDGADLLFDESLSPRQQVGKGEAGERRELEAQELPDVEAAGEVVGVVAFVLAQEGLGVHLAELGEELAPEVIAVAGDEGVVEIEDGKLHDRSPVECARGVRGTHPPGTTGICRAQGLVQESYQSTRSQQP